MGTPPIHDVIRIILEQKPETWNNLSESKHPTREINNDTLQ
jgi:hypothetical protein